MYFGSKIIKKLIFKRRGLRNLPRYYKILDMRIEKGLQILKKKAENCPICYICYMIVYYFKVYNIIRL